VFPTTPEAQRWHAGTLKCRVRISCSGVAHLQVFPTPKVAPQSAVDQYSILKSWLATTLAKRPKMSSWAHKSRPSPPTTLAKRPKMSSWAHKSRPSPQHTCWPCASRRAVNPFSNVHHYHQVPLRPCSHFTNLYAPANSACKTYLCCVLLFASSVGCITTSDIIGA